MGRYPVCSVVSAWSSATGQLTTSTWTQCHPQQLVTRLLTISNSWVPGGTLVLKTGPGSLAILASQGWEMRVAALSQQGKEGWLCKGGYLRKTLPELGTTPQGVGGASTTSGSKPGKTRRAERVIYVSLLWQQCLNYLALDEVETSGRFPLVILWSWYLE